MELTTILLEDAALAIEVLAVALVVGAVFYNTARYFYVRALRRVSQRDSYKDYKHSLARTLLLGLEILVAADVVRTVGLEPSARNVATLGLLVVVRTFLSWSLVVETEGRWPWQPSTVHAEKLPEPNPADYQEREALIPD